MIDSFPYHKYFSLAKIIISLFTDSSSSIPLLSILFSYFKINNNNNNNNNNNSNNNNNNNNTLLIIYDLQRVL